jgi:glutamine synthetase
VENRLPGMDCNPYLGIAATLACGYLGLMEKKGRAPSSGLRLYRQRRDPAEPWRCAGPAGGGQGLHDVLGADFVKVYDR